MSFLPDLSIYLRKRDQFLTVVSDLDTGEPLWAGRERKRETLDPFCAEALLPAQPGSLGHERVPFGKVEAINGNIRAVLSRGRGYRDHEYLLPKGQKATAERRRHRRAA